jgi:hypothetical protein
MERMIRRRGVRFVVGPDGYPLTVEDLPATPPRRWMIRRKAQVVAAVAGGLLTIEQACDRFMLTREEFLTWKASVARYGLPVCVPSSRHRQRANHWEGSFVRSTQF